MANYVMVAAGQCGNQLCYELMNQIDQHLQPDMYHYENSANSHQSLSSNSTKRKSPNSKQASRPQEVTGPSDDQQLLYESFFRQTTSGQSKTFSRIVALDTEPKVIDDCVVRRKQMIEEPIPSSSNRKKTPRKAAAVPTITSTDTNYAPWRYDTKSIAFRHGGAGNNWSLGYSLAQGEFLETILNCMRRQLELADISPHLVFCHSLAGGTGSGLGTRVTECAVDEFPECLTTNIVVAPYHFGEVVVQHYNALLCLSKIQSCSQSVILLENEMAQVLCKQMRGIERPSLTDLNNVLANHITPLFLPKITARSPYATLRSHFSDDVLFLASHPAYRFLNIKLTPQTSKQSVDFTFDSWSALFKTIQRMQLSGAYSERNIASHIKRLGLIPGGMSTATELDDQSYHTSSMSSYAAPIGHVRSRSTYQKPEPHSTTAASSSSWGVSSPSQDALKQGGVIRSVASVLTCHGESATSYMSDAFLQQLHHQQCQKATLPVEVLLYNNSSRGSRHGHMEEDYRSLLSTPPSTSIRQSTANAAQATAAAAADSALQQPLFDEYVAAHNSVVTDSGLNSAIQGNYSNFLLHTYQRSAHVVANDQSMLPILRRATMKSEQMFRTGAYLHQYATYGVETADFVQAFYDIGAVIQNYEQL